MYKIKSKSIIIIFTGIILYLFGCAVQNGPICIKQGKDCSKIKGLFREKWYHYYKRGLSYMECECYSAALSDFYEAMSKEYKDKRTARTYGLHFIDYFPHREAGIIHFFMGNYDAAKFELNLSITQEKTEKAYFYLDEIRKQELKQLNLPDSYPEIQSTAKNIVWTNQNKITIKGRVHDDQYVKNIYISNIKLQKDLSSKLVNFKEIINLNPGKNIILISAENLLENKSTKELIVYYDKFGPTIIIDKYNQQNGEITGELKDESGYIQLFINNKSIPIIENNNTFLFKINIKNLSDKNIKLSAKDKANNETIAFINIKQLSSLHLPLYANFSNQNIASDRSDGFISEKLPDIDLYGWHDNKIVYLENVWIKGAVSSRKKIELFSINDQSILEKVGHDNFFSHLVNLKKGKNYICFKAIDNYKNIQTKNICIERLVPEADQKKQQHVLGIYPFTIYQIGKLDINKKYNPELDMFYMNLFNKIKNKNRFRVKLLDSNNYKTTHPSYYTLIGNIYITSKGLEIVVKIVKTENEKVLFLLKTKKQKFIKTIDVYGENLNINEMAERLSQKIVNSFPLMTGIIKNIIENILIIENLQGFTLNDNQIIIYKEHKPLINPVTEDPLGLEKEVVGYGKVNEASENGCKALIISQIKPIKKKYKVILLWQTKYSNNI